ncbi:hypothetical protein [Mitsuaria sp. GD03876]|uniref:hypothetical protein n=1 Tax=Mitsuaria sp. GD03876 TaxID=2975399 RepID=UPI002448F4C9|nr:hypothetical protein [Mitsuaria sp. GD03876]MDH0863816.1 hypothetical protein [Mitsuaria sp. GD03876]
MKVTREWRLGMALTVCLLALPTLSPAQEMDERLVLARQLYACSKFYLGLSKSVEGDKRKSAQEQGVRYVVEATKDVVDLDPDPDPRNLEMTKKYSALAQQDFDAFMVSVNDAPEQERPQRMRGFMDDCRMSELRWKLRGPLKRTAP